MNTEIHPVRRVPAGERKNAMNLSIPEHIKRRPDVKPHQIYYVIRKRLGGQRRGGTFPPEDVDRWLDSLKNACGEEHRERFPDSGVTWISEGPLRADLRISRQTADSICELDPLLPSPRMVDFKQAPYRQRFWPRELLARAIGRLREAAEQSISPRTRSEIEGLPENQRVGLAEAEALGFTHAFLRAHTKFDPADPRSTTEPSPDPATGLYFAGTWRPAISARNQVVKEPAWLAGELLKSLRMRGTAIDLPSDGKLLTAVAAMVGKPRSTLASLIARGTLPRLTCTLIKSNGAAQDAPYLRESDLPLIPNYEPPGHRLFPIEGRYWCPLLEASGWASVSKDQIHFWTPKDQGGLGHPCEHLGRCLNCRRHGITHQSGNHLLVYDVHDLLIVEAKVNCRPKPLPAPAAPIMPAPSRSSGRITHAAFVAMLQLDRKDANLTAREQSKLMERLRRFGTEGTHFWKRGNRYDYDPSFCAAVHGLVKKRSSGNDSNALSDLLADPTAEEIARMKNLIRQEKGEPV